MLLWAYATLGKPMRTTYLAALAAQVQMQLPSLNAQNPAIIICAFAKLNYSPDAMRLRGCEAHATRIAGAFNPQVLVCCCLLCK